MTTEQITKTGVPHSLLDPEARIASLKARHGRPLFKFLLRLSFGEWYLAEDLLQETMIRAWRNIDRLPAEDESQRRWLFIVARRVAIDAARSRQARPIEVDISDSDVEPSANSTTEVVVAAETLRRALRNLTREQRLILNEVYINGRTTKEAAIHLGIPHGTVKSRTFYALQHIRDAMLCAE